MSSNGFITTLLTNTTSRLMPNFFDMASIVSTDTNKGAGVNEKYAPIVKKCFGIDFGGDFSLDMDYSDTTKQHFIKKANSIKSVTLSFYESGDMAVIGAFQFDFNSIFDFKTNTFKADAWPDRTISISIDDRVSVNNIKVDGTIILHNAKLSSFSYPKFNWKDKEPIEVKATFKFNYLELKNQPSNNAGTNNASIKPPLSARSN